MPYSCFVKLFCILQQTLIKKIIITLIKKPNTMKLKQFFQSIPRIFAFTMLFLFAGSTTVNAQYCSITGQDCSAGDEITSFYTSGAKKNISNKNSGCSSNGYGDFTNDTLITAPGNTFTINVMPGYYSGSAIWVDLNQDNDFNDPGEKVWDSGNYTMNLQTGAVTIPSSVTTYGSTRMRVITGFICVPNDPCNPCGYGLSETEDYTITLEAPPQNDMVISRWLSPDSTVLAGNKQISVEVINAGLQNQTPTVSYSIDSGNTWVTENITQTMQTGDSVQYTFSSPADFTSPGKYNCQAAVHVAGDTVNVMNDSLTQTIRSFSGQAVPFSENFETQSQSDWFMNFFSNPISVTFSWRPDSGRTNSRNTGPLHDHTLGGDIHGKYLTCAPTASEPAYLESPFIDTTSYSNNPQLKFFYHIYGDGGNIIIQENVNNSWNTIDSIIGPTHNSMKDPWKIKTVQLSTNAIQIRLVGMPGAGGSNIALDDIYFPANNDLSLTGYPQPSHGIDIQGKSNVTVKITNIGKSPQSNFHVKYSSDNGNSYVTDTISTNLAPDSSLFHTFTSQADLSSPGDYHMEYIVNNSGDTLNSNDTLKRTITNYTIPYKQDFDQAIPHNLPAGWDYLVGIEDGWVETRGSSALSKPNSLNFWNSSAQNGEALMAIMPPYYGNISNKWLQLWIENNDDQDTVYVGVMDNPADSTTFTPTDTITFSTDKQYKPHYAKFSNYSGTGKYIAIRHGATQNYSYMWMDNMILEKAPSGPVLASNPDSVGMHEVLYNHPDTVNRKIQLYNEGPGTLNVSNIALSGANTGNFTLIDNNTYPKVLDFGDSLYVSLKFYGDTLGSKKATIDVTANSSTYNIPVYGNVIEAKIDTFPYVETFDHFGYEPLGWFMRSKSDYKWFLNKGETPESFTGPLGDHTSGNGYYIYTEATQGFQKDSAMVITPELDFSSINDPVMNFWYHMYGYDIDTLAIDVAVNGSWNYYTDTIIGQQQNSNSAAWKMHSVDLSSYANADSIRFRATRGFSSAGDIAVDDVAFGTNYINLGPDTSIKPGDSITLNAGASSTRSYKWYANNMNNLIGTGSAITVDSAATYFVEMNDIGYFHGIDSIQISLDSLDVTITGPDTMKYYSETITLDAGSGYASYSWSTGASTQSISVDSSDVAFGANTFSVTVTNTSGATASDSKNVYVINDVGVNQHASDLQMEIYPNPNQGSFTISIKGPEADFNLEFTNTNGQLIHSEKINADEFTKRYDLSHLAKGIYFIRLTNDNMTQRTQKLIIH